MAQELFNLNWHTYSDHLKDMMQNLMHSNQSTDVTLVCEDKTRFKAHKFVLNACSPVFQSIINNMPQNDGSVIYLRGVLAPEMKSILQFMYLGQATFYQERMNEFLNVAKSLEIKEISKDVEPKTEEDSSQDKENPEYVLPNHGNTSKPETDGHASRVVKEETNSESRNTTFHNDAGQYPCNKCDKQFAHKTNVYQHIKTAHEGIKYPCHKCNKTFGQKMHLDRHIKAIHDGIKIKFQ